MLHHLNIDLSKTCIYCKKLHDAGWRSRYEHFHYKERTCTCGRKTTVRVHFYSDGNDSFGKKKTIDDTVK